MKRTGVLVWALTIAFPSYGATVWHSIWKASVAAVVAGNAGDAASSWGKGETNPALRTGTPGIFSARSIAIKGGITAAVLMPQLILKHRHAEKAMAIVNFTAAGVCAAAVAHNLTIRGQP